MGSQLDTELSSVKSNVLFTAEESDSSHFLKKSVCTLVIQVPFYGHLIIVIMLKLIP